MPIQLSHPTRSRGLMLFTATIGVIFSIAADGAVAFPAASRTAVSGRRAAFHRGRVTANRAVFVRDSPTPSTRDHGARVRDITLRVDPRRRGLGAYSDTWGDNVVFDKNHDGIPDILLSNHARPWQIWLGNGHGGFRYDRSLPPGDSHNCAAADFGGPRGAPPDGRMDLYCVRGAKRGTSNHKSNLLLIQRADGSYANVVRRWRAVDPTGRGRAVSVLDIRGNGRPSLFVGNAAGKLYPSRDHIFVNVGRRFVQRHTAGLPSTQNTYCSDTGDFNHDGRQDFVTCSFALRLYENRTTPGRRVTYRQVAQTEGISLRNVTDAELVDLNRDGWPDLVTVDRTALSVRLNRHRTPHFSKVNYTFPLTAGRSFCVGRANGDRAPDVLVVQGLRSGLTPPIDKVQRRDWLLINAGFGHRFRPLPVPQPPFRNGRNGNGNTCAAIPHFAGRRAAWSINNGYTAASGGPRGYRQLVIYTP